MSAERQCEIVCVVGARPNFMKIAPVMRALDGAGIRGRLQAFGLEGHLAQARIAVLPPAGYLEMLGLMKDARVVLTDSGGMQEETTALGVPCITLRENTERPVTIDADTNVPVGNDPERLLASFRNVMDHGGKQGRVPRYWDGRAGERIATVIGDWLGQPHTGARTTG